METSRGVKVFDSVIIAAPYSDSLEIDPKPDTSLEVTEYADLHVTLLSTAAPNPSKEYFANDTGVPTSILTSFQGARTGGKEPPFYSLTYHGRPKPDSDEWLVKIFSKRRLTAKWLAKLFDGQVGWVFRKEVRLFLFSPLPVCSPVLAVERLPSYEAEGRSSPSQNC